MEAAPTNIINYFDGSKQSLIPLFQRPYSWDKSNWKALWDDVMDQYAEEDRTSHFMGAIVTVPARSVPVGVTKHQVIDGQQRLTTLAILLMAIRRVARGMGDTTTEAIIGDLLVNRHYQAPDDLKLMPTQLDRGCYNALVYEKDLERFGESRLVQAFNFFLEQIECSKFEDARLTPQQLLQAIRASLQVVMINLGDADDPYLIFESLNHKGKPLNQSDLVRNYVLMKFEHTNEAEGEQAQVYGECWRPMETTLGSAMTEFLRHYGMMFGGNVRKNDIYSSFKTVFEALKDKKETRHELNRMKQASGAYALFLEPDTESEDIVNRKLEGFKELDSTVYYPLLLRLFLLKERALMSERELLECLMMLESFTVRRLVCYVPTNALNKITLECCAGIPESGVATWLTKRLDLGAGGRRWPDDKEFAEALLRQNLYLRRNLAKYVLVGLEEAFRHKEPVETSSATVEHIMPRTLPSAWKSALGDDWVRIHKDWLDTLGNLTLTGYNSELSNAPFAKKKELLANTHYELTRDVLACSTWGENEIVARGAQLADLAVRRWPKLAQT